MSETELNLSSPAPNRIEVSSDDVSAAAEKLWKNTGLNVQFTVGTTTYGEIYVNATNSSTSDSDSKWKIHQCLVESMYSLGYKIIEDLDSQDSVACIFKKILK